MVEDDKKPQRFVALDAFRGLTIAGMILVNNPGSWGAMYAPLGHAKWDGWTPTDFVFPFFLYIVGVAMTFSFDKRLAAGVSQRDLMVQVIRRTIILIMLGWTMGGVPNLRLFGRFVLLIAALNLIYAELPLLSRGSTPDLARKKTIGWILLGITALWWIVDWGYFNGVVHRSSWSNLFPLDTPEGSRHLRYPGVLFRIALCYLLASMIMMRTGLIGRIAWTLLLLSVYNFIITYFGPLGWYLFEDGMGRRVDSPLDTPFRGELHDFIDQVVFGRHLYSRMPDPEGLLSTLPAIATTLCGVLTGMWLLTKRSMQQKASIMVLAGLFLILVGLGMDLFFPINKKIWSSSYVVFSAGWAAAILALCVWVIDIMGYKRMAHPFVVYGMNAIFVFFMSGIAAKMLAITKWANDDGKTMSLKGWLNQTLVKSWTTDPKFSSLMFAIFTVTFWWFICWLLYKRRIFIKV